MTPLWQVFLGAVVIAIAVLLRRYSDRSKSRRIREEIARYGGELQDISSGWSGLYKVRYKTRAGQLIEAQCMTSFTHIRWLRVRNTPPGLAVTNSSAAEVSQASPAEPITCLACEASIPASGTQCPACGWSYQRR